MSIDVLQERIRKLKCPIVVDLCVKPQQIPPHLQDESYERFARELMEGLKGVVPAVRLSFDFFALMPGGLQMLSNLLKQAAKLGFYVVLDGPSMCSPWAAEQAAETIFAADSLYPCDAMVLSPYVGSDVIKPFTAACKKGKSVFFAVRSANKSAAELQDLMVGSRLVYQAAADIVNRYAAPAGGRSGYNSIGLLTAATSASAVQNLRSKYPRLFLLVDGYDYPGGNAKNCSYGFDKLGHGAAVSIGPAIVAAWTAEEGDGTDYIAKAIAAAERIQGNLNRYFSIL